MTRNRRLAEIEVQLEHPFGTLRVPLTQWIALGPGPRPGVRPTAARNILTGTALPLRAIPLRYRNTRLSRLLIALRIIADPWPQPPAE